MAFEFTPDPAPTAPVTGGFSFEPDSLPEETQPLPTAYPSADVPQLSATGEISFAPSPNPQFKFSPDEPLGFLENSIDVVSKFGKGLGRGLASGVNNWSRLTWDVMGFVGETMKGLQLEKFGKPGMEVITEATGKVLDEFGQPLEEMAKGREAVAEAEFQSQIRSVRDEIFMGAGRSTGSSAFALAAGVAAGPAGPLASSLAASTTIGFTTGVDEYYRAIDSGIDGYRAFKHGLYQGVVEAATEAPTFKALFDDTGLMKKFLNSMLRELPTEQVATVLQSLENKILFEPDKPWAAWFDQVTREMALTAATVPLVIGAQSGTVALAQKADATIRNYQILKERAQIAGAYQEVKSENAKKVEEQLQKLLSEVGEEGDAQDAAIRITYLGMPPGEVDEISPATVGRREIGPQLEGVESTRAYGLLSSESKQLSAIYTKGPSSEESITETERPEDMDAGAVGATAPPTTINLTGMGQAISDNFYRDYFAALSGATQSQAFAIEPSWQRAQQAFSTGQIKSPEDLKAFLNPAPSPALVTPPLLGDVVELGNVPQKTLAATRLERALAPVYRSWAAWQTGDLNVHILDNMSQLPDEILTVMRENRDPLVGNEELAKGIYDGAGSVYLFSDNILTPEEAQQTLFHEAVGHFGMDQVVPGWNKGFVYDLMKNVDKLMPEEARYVKAVYKDYSEVQQAREILARFAETHPDATNTYFEHIWSSLRNWVRQMGFSVEVTRKDAIEFLRRARDTIEEGTVKPFKAGKPALQRSKWDPRVRRWGEQLLGTTDFEIIEDASPQRVDLGAEPEGQIYTRTIREEVGSDGVRRRIWGATLRKNGKIVAEIERAYDPKDWTPSEIVQDLKALIRESAGGANNERTGKPVVLRAYHGSVNGDRPSFDNAKLGSFTGAKSAKIGHFFATNPKNTHTYAFGIFESNAAEAFAKESLLDRLINDRDQETVRKKIREFSKYDVISKLAKNGEPLIYLTREGVPLTRGELQKIPGISSMTYGTGVLVGPKEAVPTFVTTERAKTLANDLANQEWRAQPEEIQAMQIENWLQKEPVYSTPITFPVYVAAKNPKFVGSSEYSDTGFTEQIQRAWDEGHDVAVLVNARDPDLDNVVVVHPDWVHTVRSVNARLDPKQVQANDLLASRGKVHPIRLDSRNYLDLQKPLAEQAEGVKEALRKAGVVPGPISGQDFYDAIAKREGGQKQASEWLLKNGIPGASYVESFRPRGRPEQLVRNYITFSQKDAAILSAAGQQTLAEEKARLEKLTTESVKEKLKKPIDLSYRQRMTLFGKALKMPRDQLADLQDGVTEWNWFLKWATGIEEIAAVNPTLVPLQMYVQNARAFWSTKGQVQTAANEQIRRWRRTISPTQSADFDTLMYEADILSEKLGRRLTKDEVVQLAQDHGLKTLTAESLAFAEKIWDDYANIFEQVRTAAEIEASKLENTQMRARKIADINTKMGKMKNRNYFPKSNFGQFTVEFYAKEAMTIDGQDFKEGELVWKSTHQTQREQLAATAEMQKKQFPVDRFRNEMHKIQDSRLMEFVGIPDSFYGELLEFAEEFFENPNDVIALDEQLQGMKYEASPISRAMRRILREVKAPGYDTNSMRVYGEFFQRMGNQLAKLKYNSNMQANINSLSPVVGDNTKRDALRQYMREHRAYLMNPGNEWAWLRGFGFNWYIGFVPKSALVNLTQTPVVTLAYLGNKYGTLAATKALATNMDAYMAHFKEGKLARDSFSKGTPGQTKLAMMQQLLHEGILNESFANELAAVAEGATFEDMLGKKFNAPWARKVDRGFRWTTDKMAFMFHHTELINRYIAAGAAYDLARSAGKSHEEAVTLARTTVQRTQGEYARYNRPKAGWGKSSALFLFMRYLSHMMWFVGYEPAKWRVMLGWLLLGGVSGLPFAENLMDLIDGSMTFFKKKLGVPDPFTDSRTAMLEWVSELRADPNNPFAEFIPNPDMVMHGLARQIPLPFTDQTADVSGSVSLGRILPFTEHLSQGATRESLGMAVLGSLGAVSDIGVNFFDALSSDNIDKWKASEGMMPMSLRNISAAVRWAVRGYEENSTGQPIVTFDPEKDIGAVWAKAFGFPSTGVNQMREMEWAQRSAQRFYDAWKTQALKRVYEAAMRGNDEELSAAIAAVHRYNEQVPYPEMSITRDQMMESILTRAKKDALHELGLPVTLRSHSRLYMDIQGIHEQAK